MDNAQPPRDEPTPMSHGDFPTRRSLAQVHQQAKAPTRSAAHSTAPTRVAAAHAAPTTRGSQVLPLAGLSPKWISAGVVSLLSLTAGLNAAWGNSMWVSVIMISTAGIILVAGWERMVGAPIPLPSQIFMSLSAIVSTIAVAFVQDQVAIVFVVGVLLAGLVGIEIWTAPSPRDHSAALPPATPSTPPVQVTTAADSEETHDEQYVTARRNSWVASSTSSSLASSVTGLLISVGGTAWIAMSAADAWRLLLPIATFIVAAVVIGDQIGSSWKGQSFFALLLGVLTGGIGAALMIFWGHGATLGQLVLPSVAQYVGPQGTVMILGVGTGVIVAVAVTMIDAVFGSHGTDGGRLSAAARGAAKFLMCGLVVYTVLRVAGS